MNTLNPIRHGQMPSRRLTIPSYGLMANRWPRDWEVGYLLKKYAVPPHIADHGEAVAQMAATLASALPSADSGLLRAACLLHDIARSMEGDHAAQGAEILRREGYPQVARLIATHHDLPPDAGLEADLLYLADKRILGTVPVSLEARFAASRAKCQNPHALAAWRRRYDAALDVARRYHLEA